MIRSTLHKANKLKERLLWQWVGNFGRTISYRLSPSSQENSRLTELKSNGIVIEKAATLLDAKGLRCLDDISAYVKKRVKDPDVLNVMNTQDSGSDRKPFFAVLTPKSFDFDSPFIQLALHPALLNLSNAYLGMNSMIRSVEAWLHFPTEGELMETQLWHRDVDDVMNIKVFIYLNDVERKTGPFCFVPETQPRGRLQWLAPVKDSWGRTNDQDMNSLVPETKWTVCTGSARTVVFADTTGYHKGLKPAEGQRYLVMVQYSSGKPQYPRAMQINQIPKDRHWSNAERSALFG